MNKVMLIGRLTRDPEIRGEGDKKVAKFSLAVDRFSKDNGADFPNCVAFGKKADFAEKWLKKGSKIAVEGRIQTGSYTNKDGVKVYTTDIVVDNSEFVESRSRQEAAAPSTDSDLDFMSVPDTDDESLPFH